MFLHQQQQSLLSIGLHISYVINCLAPHHAKCATIFKDLVGVARVAIQFFGYEKQLSNLSRQSVKKRTQGTNPTLHLTTLFLTQ